MRDLLKCEMNVIFKDHEGIPYEIEAAGHNPYECPGYDIGQENAESSAKVNEWNNKARL